MERGIFRGPIAEATNDQPLRVQIFNSEFRVEVLLTAHEAQSERGYSATQTVELFIDSTFRVVSMDDARNL